MSAAHTLGYQAGYNSGMSKQAGVIDSVGQTILKLLSKAPDKLAAPALSLAAHGMPAGADLAAQKAHIIQSLGGFGVGAGGGLGLMALANSARPQQAPPPFPVQ